MTDLGGKREGAGRKASPDERKIPLAIRLAVELSEYLATVESKTGAISEALRRSQIRRTSCFFGPKNERETMPTKTSKSLKQSLAEKLASELLKAGGRRGQPATRIAFKLDRGDGKEIDLGGFCEYALVRFFQSNLPI